MEIARGIEEARARCAAARAGGMEVGFVPTMGALHAGHEALIRAARRDTGFVVVSIFVNPAQFGPQEDFQRYPRPFDRDVDIARRLGVGLVFAPSADEMYPPEHATVVAVDRLTAGLCGASRPGHFQGVTTVVAKLLNIVTPHRAYFGEKDYQQLRIVQQMVEDLDMPVRIVPIPTVREPDGLAMSSRNAYLGREEREAARLVPASLEAASESRTSDAALIRRTVEGVLRGDALIRIDYIAIVDDAIQEVAQVRPGNRLCLAVWIGNTRLIDNRALPGS